MTIVPLILVFIIIIWGVVMTIPDEDKQELILLDEIRVGDKIMINVNPNDYLDVYFKPDKMSIIKNYISSISVLILVTIVLVGLFK